MDSYGFIWIYDDLCIWIRMYLYGDGSKPYPPGEPQITGKWMFIPLKMVCIGIDP